MITPTHSSVLPRNLVSSLLSNIRAIHAELAALKNFLPTCIADALVKNANRRKLVVTGLGSGTTRANVSQLLSLVGVPSSSILTVVPLGRPTSGIARPACVELVSEVAMPHFKSLAVALKTSPAFSHCSVRRYEDPEERHRLYLERVNRRAQQIQSINTPETSMLVEQRPADPEIARSKPIDNSPILEPCPISPLVPAVTQKKKLTKEEIARRDLQTAPPINMPSACEDSESSDEWNDYKDETEMRRHHHTKKQRVLSRKRMKDLTASHEEFKAEMAVLRATLLSQFHN